MRGFDNRRYTKAPFAKLASVLGNQASLIQRLSFGIDDRAVEASRQIKSIGDESTYEKDLTESADIDRQIAIHSDVVAKRLRRHKLAGRTISLKIRFASFRTVTRSLSLEEGQICRRKYMPPRWNSKTDLHE